MKRIIIGMLVVVCCGIFFLMQYKKPKNQIPLEPWVAELGSGVIMELMPVAAGRFDMGANDSDAADREKPVHRVILTRPFWIGKCEVTQKQYEQVMENNPSRFEGADNPVENVSWNDAIEFCKKLTDKEHASGRLPASYKYTLPTEAQWEFAARGGNNSKGYKYSGSDDLDRVGWYYENSGDKRLDDSSWSTDKLSSNNCETHAVGQKSPNELGLYDMSGNVWEWCSDWYDLDYYDSGAMTNPTGASSGSFRGGRGGSWYSYARYCRSADRVGLTPASLDGNLGFRLCLQTKNDIDTESNIIKTAVSNGSVAINSKLDKMLQDSKQWIAHLGNEVTMELLPVGAGSFDMGSNDSDADSDEKPVHRVTLTKPFWIGKYEVTQKQYEQIMGSNPSSFKGADNPVEKVSWNDAMEFCKKLTEKEHDSGRLPLDYKYTLPTEAQWEFAARGGNESRGYKYSGSDDLEKVGWHRDNSDKKPHSVGQKSPNELGLYDMSGNVYEWCSDWYDSDYYDGGSMTDPTGTSSGSFRVGRGGCWHYIARYCCSALRHWHTPTSKYGDLGFRLCLQTK